MGICFYACKICKLQAFCIQSDKGGKMRVSPLTEHPSSFNYNLVQTHQNKKKEINNSNSINLNNLNSNYNQLSINFLGTPNVSKELVKQIPLEDRLASIFQNFIFGDVILVGKDLNECAKQMHRNTNLVKNVIKRAFFIEDDNIGGNLAFMKNGNGDTEIINLCGSDITLISANKTYPLKPDDSFYVVKDDILNIQGNLLTIKEKSKTDLSMFRKVFARAFNFDKNKEIETEVDKLNKKTLSQLLKQQHKTATPVTFAEVGGYKELKDKLKKDIIYPLSYPEAYERMDLNHGIILYGPPGTGKTHIARALANEAGANFIGLNGLDLESKWVGESEENWRTLFKEAKESQPSIIFLDEFDAVARSRDSRDEYGNKVVNQILTLMTDIDNEGDNVFVIGATNNYKALDAAITRSGRFGKHYEVTPPDLSALREILDVHTKSKPVDENFDKENFARQLHKLKATGADVKQLVSDAYNNGYIRAGIFEKMDNKTFKQSDIDNFKITKDDFQLALDEFTKSKQNRKPIGFNN